jgi:hypothetical protein
VYPGACLDVTEKNFLPIPGIETILLGRPAHNLVAMQTELSRLMEHVSRVPKDAAITMS